MEGRDKEQIKGRKRGKEQRVVLLYRMIRDVFSVKVALEQRPE